MLKAQLTDGTLRLAVDKTFAILMFLIGLGSISIYFLASFLSTSLLLPQAALADAHNATLFVKNATMSQIPGNFQNNTMHYTNRINFTFYVNATVADNVTIVWGNNSETTLENTTTGNTTWTNRTPITIRAEGRNYLYNFTLRITGRQVWSNASTSQVFGNFTINEHPTNGISISEGGGDGLVNRTLYNSTARIFNVTTNVTVASCTAYYGNGTSRVLANNSAVMNVWRNASAMNDTAFAANDNFPFNATYSCQDAFGNLSWMNTSALAGYTLFGVDTVAPRFDEATLILNNVSAGSNVTRSQVNDTLTFANNYSNQTVSQFSINSFWRGFSGTPRVTNVTTVVGGGFVEVDSTNGVVRLNTTAGNVTTGTYNVSYDYVVAGSDPLVAGNYINYTIRLDERNPGNVSLSVVLKDTYNSLSFQRFGVKNNVENAYYEFNISGNYTTRDGLYDFVVSSMDDTGRSATFATNFTWAITNLGQNANIVTWYENITMSEALSWHPNITSVSKFDNNFCCKNFTTATKSTSTNHAALINATHNVTYVFTNLNITLMRQWKNTGDGALNGMNLTIMQGWNLISVELAGLTLNQTMFSNRSVSNSTVNGTGVNGTSMNITHVSFYNSTLGLFCTARRGFSTSSCYNQNYVANNITLIRGVGMWMATNWNLTLNRSTLDS